MKRNSVNIVLSHDYSVDWQIMHIYEMQIFHPPYFLIIARTLLFLGIAVCNTQYIFNTRWQVYFINLLSLFRPKKQTLLIQNSKFNHFISNVCEDSTLFTLSVEAHM